MTRKSFASSPPNLQKLIWIAFHYQHWIKEFEKSYRWRGDEENAKKLDKYVEAYKNNPELVNKIWEKYRKENDPEKIVIQDPLGILKC